MLPPVFETLSQPPVQQYVGTNPTRIFDFGASPANVLRPYIVFSQISGNPSDNISDAPRVDFDAVQIDAYGEDRAQIRALGKAVQAALDDAGVANRLSIQTFEPETGLYRIGFDADFITHR